MNRGMERVVYVGESVFEIRELNSWIHGEGKCKGCGVHIDVIQDSHGTLHEPVLEAEWREVCEGVVSRRVETIPGNYSHELRMDSMYLPIRVRFCSWSGTADNNSGEHDQDESRYWVRYVKE